VNVTAVQERGGGGDAAAAFRTARGIDQLPGHLLVRGDRRMRAMPGSTIGIRLRIGSGGDAP
jgi:hypothetical protein